MVLSLDVQFRKSRAILEEWRTRSGVPCLSLYRRLMHQFPLASYDHRSASLKNSAQTPHLGPNPKLERYW